MNSNIHWRENGLCIVPAMLVHHRELLWLPVQRNIELMNINESSLMAWLDLITSREVTQEREPDMQGRVWLTDPWGIKLSVFTPTIIVFLNERLIFSFIGEERMSLRDQSGGKSAGIWLHTRQRELLILVRTCEVCVVWGVDEIMRKREGHVFALVQLLRRNDAVLFPIQVPGEAFHWDLTCVNTTQHSATVNCNFQLQSIVWSSLFFQMAITYTKTWQTNKWAALPNMHQKLDTHHSVLRSALVVPIAPETIFTPIVCLLAFVDLHLFPALCFIHINSKWTKLRHCKPHENISQMGSAAGATKVNAGKCCCVLD